MTFLNLNFSCRSKLLLSPLTIGVLTLLFTANVNAQEALSLRPSSRLLDTTSDLPSNSLPSFVSGDKVEIKTEIDTVLSGNAQFRRPNFVLRADEIRYEDATDIASATGRVRLNSRGGKYTADSGQVQVDSGEGFVLMPTYELKSTAGRQSGHGKAERIDFLDSSRSRITAGDYTSCRKDGLAGPEWAPDWLLRANSLEIDQEENTGYAKGASLEFLGHTVLKAPDMSFALNDARKSGWLPPTIGLDNKSGLNLALPYYWNIAPNRDLTITPEIMLRRGAGVYSNFRYLENNYAGSIDLHYMPDDKLRGGKRWAYFTQHAGTYKTPIEKIGNIGAWLNLNRVSDDDYWRDFSHFGQSATTRLLASDGGFNWSNGALSTSLRALKWQTLQSKDVERIIPPYDRLPQLTVTYAKTNQKGFDYTIQGDFTHFQAKTALTGQPNAKRTLLNAVVAYPLQKEWGFLKPALHWNSAHYSFSAPLAGGQKNHTRHVPTISVDSGLIFERQANYFGRNFQQTLEPRLMYVYTPYREQNHLPNYDTGQYDFNFATIWLPNSFVGGDRVIDNNLITAGLSTRLLDTNTGAEIVRLSAAQRYRFTEQKVTLAGGTPAAKGLSDLLLGATINWTPKWSFDSVVQYNTDTRKNTRTTIHTRYTPEKYKVANLAYRHQRDLNSRHIDFSWQWPLSDLAGLISKRSEIKDQNRSYQTSTSSCKGKWYSAGRINYSIEDKKVVDTVVGLEYNAGCWVGRIALEKLSGTSTRRVLFQIEFTGLARVGSNSLQSLQNNIPRYQSITLDSVNTQQNQYLNYD